jgi:hypothetical protein
MSEQGLTRVYRVTYLNLHNGVRHAVVVSAPTEWLARKAADQALQAHVIRTAGHVSDWAHYATAAADALDNT